MIELALVVCLANEPANCKDVGLVYDSEALTPMQCLMRAPPEIAKWTEFAPQVEREALDVPAGGKIRKDLICGARVRRTMPHPTARVRLPTTPRFNIRDTEPTDSRVPQRRDRRRPCRRSRRSFRKETDDRRIRAGTPFEAADRRPFASFHAQAGHAAARGLRQQGARGGRRRRTDGCDRRACHCPWPSPSDPGSHRRGACSRPSSAGFLISALGGSRFQIGGPAGAFVVLIASIVEHHGYDGLVLATSMAGLMMIAAGFLQIGTYIKYIPLPVTVGFTAGIAVIILASSGQGAAGSRHRT